MSGINRSRQVFCSSAGHKETIGARTRLNSDQLKASSSGTASENRAEMKKNYTSFNKILLKWKWLEEGLVSFHRQVHKYVFTRPDDDMLMIIFYQWGLTKSISNTNKDLSSRMTKHPLY